jgi:cholesterol transport system auxiliary component
MMDRRTLLTGAAALALSAPLAACSGNLIGPPDAGPIFVMRPDFPHAAAGTGGVDWALSILHPDIASGLDNDRIALMQPDGTMDYYAKATYQGRLSMIVQQALLDGFEGSGRITKVAREEDALHSDYNLVVEVKDFEAKYSQQDGIPAGVVTLSVKLTTAHGRDIVQGFSTTQSVNATANSAAAAAQALQQALSAAVTQVVGWALDAPEPARMPGAPPQGKRAEELLHQTTRGSNRLRVTPPTPQ